jgi:hypothetical protein
MHTPHHSVPPAGQATWPGRAAPAANPVDTFLHSGRRTGGTDVNYILVMKNEHGNLVGVGPVSIEYQAAMLRDELEETVHWTTVGIARVISEEQARSRLEAATGPGS